MLWAIVYADDAGVASRSQLSLAKMKMAIVEVCAALCPFVVVEQKTAIVHMHSPRMKAAGRRYKQVESFVCIGSKINGTRRCHHKVECRSGQA